MASTKVSVAEARQNFARLIKRAEHGNAIEITRRGEPVAVLVSASEYAAITGERSSFIEAARSVGVKPARIITRHLIPNLISPIVVLATLEMGSLMLAISGLSFLGLGAQPPTPEWGAMLNDGRPFLHAAPQLMIYPGLAITLTVLGLNLLGDGLRDALDPRLK